jgi:hypothetical protein
MVPSSKRATEEAQEMLSTKIRTTVVSIAAASSIALAVLPAAATAAPNIPGRFQKSAEGVKMKEYDACGAARSALSTANEMYVKDQKEGDLEGAKYWGELREGITERGHSMGCWA